MKLSNIERFLNTTEMLANQFSFDLSDSLVTFGPDSVTVSFPDGNCTVEITYTENDHESPNP